MSGASLGTFVALTLLGFAGWYGYRVVLVGGTCLVLASGGLLLQKTVGWMPADQVEQLTYQFGTVVAAAVIAIPVGLRRILPEVGVVIAAVFAVVTFGCWLFADAASLMQMVLLALTLLLVLIAVHMRGETWLMVKADGGTSVSVRRIWRSGMAVASAGILGTVASGLIPQVWLALGLLLLSWAAIAAAVPVTRFAVILARNVAFARAWVKRWSSTRRRATADLVKWIAAAVGTAMPLEVVAIVQPSVAVSVVLLAVGAACLIAGGTMWLRMQDHAAHHRYIVDRPVNPQSALRGLVAVEPVYRLLPGISGRDE